MRYHPIVIVVIAAHSLLPLRADPRVDREIEQSALASPDLREILQGDVIARADRGVVTLTGQVRDRDERALVEQRVRQLPGVREVDNRLEVSTPGPERGDGWIALQLRSVLLLRKQISARRTEVTVQDGVVTLAGTAENEDQRRLTEVAARSVEGVRAVRNEIHVRPAAPPPSLPPADDALVTARIGTALRTAGPPRGGRVSIESHGGVVTLRGRVPSAAEKHRASALAAAAPGVTSVVDETTVEAAE